MSTPPPLTPSFSTIHSTLCYCARSMSSVFVPSTSLLCYTFMNQASPPVLHPAACPQSLHSTYPHIPHPPLSSHTPSSSIQLPLIPSLRTPSHLPCHMSFLNVHIPPGD